MVGSPSANQNDDFCHHMETTNVVCGVKGEGKNKPAWAKKPLAK